MPTERDAGDPDSILAEIDATLEWLQSVDGPRPVEARPEPRDVQPAPVKPAVRRSLEETRPIPEEPEPVHVHEAPRQTRETEIVARAVEAPVPAPPAPPRPAVPPISEPPVAIVPAKADAVAVTPKVYPQARPELRVHTLSPVMLAGAAGFADEDSPLHAIPSPPPVRSGSSVPRAGLALGALALVALAAVFFFRARLAGASSPESKQGRITVESSPIAAEILIDGRARGTSPLTTYLDPGPHTLTVRANGLERGSS